MKRSGYGITSKQTEFSIFVTQFEYQKNEENYKFLSLSWLSFFCFLSMSKIFMFIKTTYIDDILFLRLWSNKHDYIIQLSMCYLLAHGSHCGSTISIYMKHKCLGKILSSLHILYCKLAHYWCKFLSVCYPFAKPDYDYCYFTLEGLLCRILSCVFFSLLVGWLVATYLTPCAV